MSIDVDDVMVLLASIKDGRGDSVADWFAENVNSPVEEFRVMFTIAQAAGFIVRNMAGKESLAADEGWIMQNLPAANPDAASWRSTQMLVAGLNDDGDMLEALIRAHLKEPDEQIAGMTVVYLAAAFRDFARMSEATRDE